MQSSTSIVILIPTHNRASLLERTLNSVLECTPISDRKVRLIVIENGGQFGAQEIVNSKTSSWIKLEYRFYKLGNKSGALNSVIDTLDNSFIIFLDDDIRVEPSLLIHYSNASLKESGGKFYGGSTAVDYEEKPQEWLLPYLPTSAKGWSPDSFLPIYKDLCFLGFNWAAFSDDIKKAGCFNTLVGPGGTTGGTGQEHDMQKALLSHGVTPVYIKEAIVWHYVPKSRCSPKWILDRTFRNAISNGLQNTTINSQRMLAGIPIWLIKEIIKSGLSVVKSRFHFNEKERFIAMHNFIRNLGTMRGIRIKSAQH